MVNYRLILGMMASKLLGNMSLLIMYPLAPFLEVEWGLTMQQMVLLNVVSEAAAFPAGFLSPMGDHLGNFLPVIVSWVIVTLSSISLLAPPVFGVLLMLRFVFNFCYTIFQTAVQSEMIDHVGSADRGWVTGLLELTFAISIMLSGVFLVIFNYFNWRTTFGILGGLMIPCLFEIWYTFPRRKHGKSTVVQENENENKTLPAGLDETSTRSFEMNEFALEDHQGETDVENVDVTSSDEGVVGHGDDDVKEKKKNMAKHFIDCFTKGTIAFCLSAAMLSIAHNAIYTCIFYYARDEYGYSPSDMSFILLAVGGGSIVGSILVTLYSDRGIYLGLYLGTFEFALGIIVFMFTASISAAVGITVVFFLFIGAEYCFVVSIAEVEAYLPPQFRTSLVGIHFQAQFVGRAIGAQVGESLYHYGLNYVLYSSLAAVAIHTICIIIAQRYKPA